MSQEFLKRFFGSPGSSSELVEAESVAMPKFDIPGADDEQKTEEDIYFAELREYTSTGRCGCSFPTFNEWQAERRAGLR